MFERRSLILACMLFALALFTSGMGYAQEISEFLVTQGQVGAEDSMPEINTCFEEEEVILEEIKATFGAHSVCGVRCSNTYPVVNCTSVCGDYATCYKGYCLFS